MIARSAVISLLLSQKEAIIAKIVHEVDIPKMSPDEERKLYKAIYNTLVKVIERL